MNKLSSLIFSSLLLLQITPTAFAGHKEGNGGDMCEDRIKVIRDDIASWIQKGGSKGLKLQNGTNQSEYDLAMLKNISSARISCTSDKVLVGGVEKTCKNYIDDSNSQQILCNAQRFLGTNDSEQYVLVHHEYAGLAGIEVANQGDSNYEVSNQISGYLENEVIKKLVVKPSACDRNCAPPDSTFEYDRAKQLFDNGQAPNLDALVGSWKLVARAAGPDLEFFRNHNVVPVGVARFNIGYKEDGLLNDDGSLETFTFKTTSAFDGSKTGKAHAENLGDKSHSQDSDVVIVGPNGAIYYTHLYTFNTIIYYPFSKFITLSDRILRTCKSLGSDRLICVLSYEYKDHSQKIHSIEGFTRVRQ